MNTPSVNFPRWSTSSHGDAADTAPMDLEHLGSHFTACNDGRGRWFALQCLGESVHDFLAPRIVTTLFLATAVIGLTAALV